MGLKFRKSVRLFPGVRLNFSGGRISTTVGIPGASLNLGFDGRAHMTLGVPGSGLSYRASLVPPRARTIPAHPTVPSGWPPSLPSRAPTTRSPLPGEIRSAAVGGLTSPTLLELKTLVDEAASRRRYLESEIKGLERSLTWRRLAKRVAGLFLLRLATRWAMPRLEEWVETTRMSLEASKRELELTTVEMDFDFDVKTLQAFDDLCQAHQRVQRSARIWDVTSAVATDRVRERTLAGTAVIRTPVQFGRSRSDLVKARWEALLFGNANGEPLQFFPGFLLLRERAGEFALVEMADLEVLTGVTRFHEEEGITHDAPVVGHTWKKSNKDGSRDKRFANNYQIPIALYGDIRIRSTTGLNEAFMVSNAEAALAFGAAFQTYRETLIALAKKSVGLGANGEHGAGPIETELEIEPDLGAPTPGRPSLIPDAAVLVLLVAGIATWMVRPEFFLSAVDQAASLATSEAAITTQPPAALNQLPQQFGPASGPAPRPVHQPPTALSTPPASPPVADPMPVVTVKARVANIRARPTIEAPVVRTAQKGDQLKVIRRQGTWHQVGEGDRVGWIHQSVIETAGRP